MIKSPNKSLYHSSRLVGNTEEDFTKTITIQLANKELLGNKMAKKNS